MRRITVFCCVSLLLLSYWAIAFGEEAAVSKPHKVFVELVPEAGMLLGFDGPFGENVLLVKNAHFPGDPLLVSTWEGEEISIPSNWPREAVITAPPHGASEEECDFLVINVMRPGTRQTLSVCFPEFWEIHRGCTSVNQGAQIVSDLDQPITGEVEGSGEISVPLRYLSSLKPLSFEGELVSLPTDEMDIDLGIGVLTVQGLTGLSSVHSEKEWPSPDVRNLSFEDGLQRTGKVTKWPQGPIVIRIAKGEVMKFKLEEVARLDWRGQFSGKPDKVRVELVPEAGMLLGFQGPFGENAFLARNVRFPEQPLLARTEEGEEISIPADRLMFFSTNRISVHIGEEEEFEYHPIVLTDRHRIWKDVWQGKQGTEVSSEPTYELIFPEFWEFHLANRTDSPVEMIPAQIISEAAQPITGEVEGLGEISVPLRDLLSATPHFFAGKLLALPTDEMEIDIGLCVLTLRGLSGLSSFFKDGPTTDVCCLSFLDGQRITGRVTKWPAKPIVVRNAEGELTSFKLEEVRALARY